MRARRTRGASGWGKASSGLWAMGARVPGSTIGVRSYPLRPAQSATIIPVVVATIIMMILAMAVMAVAAVAIARYIHVSWIGRGLRTLRDSEDAIVIGDYLFVHAGVRPGVAIDDQAASDLIWIRDDAGLRSVTKIDWLAWTAIGVNELVLPGLLIEIRATAVINT